MSEQYVTCKRCGWVHFAYSRQRAAEEVARFNTYFDSLPYEKQKEYYGGIKFVDGVMTYGEPQKATIGRYESCGQCRGHYRDFRDALDEDCPRGCTVSPILHYNEPIQPIEQRVPRFGYRKG